MITDNRVLFHRVANTLNYLDIKTVVVCGTCFDQLQGYSSKRSSPAAASSTSTSSCWRRASPWPAQQRLPLPRPLPHAAEAAGTDEDGEGPVGPNVVKSERCCGESGTLA